jgi:hypothetical protein
VFTSICFGGFSDEYSFNSKNRPVKSSWIGSPVDLLTILNCILGNLILPEVSLLDENFIHLPNVLDGVGIVCLRAQVGQESELVESF